MVCMADCLPQCTYKWYYASSPMGRRYEGTTGNTLFANWKFTNIYYSYYYCEATNDHRSSYSNWIKIDVKGTCYVNVFSSLYVNKFYHTHLQDFSMLGNSNDKFLLHKT